MRLLVLGGLGPYPERLATFLAHGHQLWYASTHYLPAVQDQIGEIPALSLDDAPDVSAVRLVELIRSERIDAVYSLLNVWDGSNPVTAGLLLHGCPVPLIRHYKEHYVSPNDDERTCIERADGVIFINEESRDYFAGIYRSPVSSTCLDADPIPSRYLKGTLKPKLSSADHRPHLLIAGTVTTDGTRYDYRSLIHGLAEQRAHVHLYAHFRRLDPSTGWMLRDEAAEAEYGVLATESEYVHLHPPIAPDRFVDEWSRYDAGLLHVSDLNDHFRPFNLPNRYTAYIAAGVPIALATGDMPAMERHLQALGAVVVYDELADLVERLPDPAASAAALAAREGLTWEAVYPALEAFIRSCLP